MYPDKNWLTMNLENQCVNSKSLQVRKRLNQINALEELIRLAKHNRKVREANKLESSYSGSTEASVKQSSSNSRAKLSPSSFSLTQILSIASIVLSLTGLYHKRKEVMALVIRKQLHAQPQLTEANLECRPEQPQTKSPLTRPMDWESSCRCY